jgi:hypothetical protein
VNYEQFISKLEKNKIDFALFRFDALTYVEAGRLAFAFDGCGKSTGGWIRDCSDDWRADWQEWFALLTDPI